MPEEDLGGAGGKLRLFIDGDLGAGLGITPGADQVHYLLRVMRAAIGDHLRLFNGRDGEWRARIVQLDRRGCQLVCEAETAPQRDVSDLWLAFAPIKRTPSDYVSQKATELGVRVLQPVITHRTVVARVNIERMHANAVEAAEQSGRLTVPEVRTPIKLAQLLRSWPQERRLVFCDEGGQAGPIAEVLHAKPSPGPWGVLTGPEGGFDAEERSAIRSCSFVVPVSLGPRIMRADTAALAALAILQAISGDWQSTGAL